MVHLSNGLLGTLNFLTLLLSNVILTVGILLSRSSNCLKFTEKPLISIGIFLVVVSLAGLIGSCRRVSWLLILYLISIFILIVLLLSTSIFEIIIAYNGAYRTNNNSHYWNTLKICLHDRGPCSNLAKSDFPEQKLSRVQSGCCKPPTSCDFVFQNATVWSNPKNKTEFLDTDCWAWKNDRSKLCYDCNSCMAEFLAFRTTDWKTEITIEIIAVIFLIIVFSVGCWTMRNIRADNHVRPIDKPYP